MKLILIEGVPGSGKSTLAETLCDTAIASGMNASWFLEESKNHPVHPLNVGKREKTTEYFMHQWNKFVSSNVDKDHLFILEGSLFQSTVRFIMEENSEPSIPEYFQKCEEILKICSAKLIYLRPPDISSHIDWVAGHRGIDWSSKVSNYLESTPFCTSRNLRGETILREFWSYYAHLCDLLVLGATTPNCTLKSGIGYYEELFTQAKEFTDLA